MPSPLVSIIIPSWQQARFLRYCLQSLLAQTYPRVEVLVYDNLSTDGTATVLAELASRLSSVVCEKDRGQSDALRKGFAASRGEILGWLNADDMLMPRAIETAVDAFLKEPRADVVYGQCALLDGSGQLIHYYDELQSSCCARLLSISNVLAQPSTFFRREAYERVGGLDRRLNYAMDWDLWCRFARSGCRFEFVPEVLSGARVHADAKTADPGWAHLLEIARVNLRHSSTLVPWALLLHIATHRNNPARSALGPLASPITTIVRNLMRRAGLVGAKVNGLAPRGGITEPKFRIQVPIYERIHGACLTIRGVAGSATLARVQASVNEQPMSSGSLGNGVNTLTWFAGPEPLAELVIEGLVDRLPSQGLEFSLRLDLAGGRPGELDWAQEASLAIT